VTLILTKKSPLKTKTPKWNKNKPLGYQ
jgi:hypothetical protein